MAAGGGGTEWSDEGDDNLEYYALLNVGKNANPEDVRRAYRRLCKTFHPDRYRDERRQGLAAELFPRIQEAYRILSDPRLREIYDRRGKVGLLEDMAIVERTPIPSELLEEYEKLRALWEERTYIQDSFPVGKFKVKVDATGLMDGVRNYKDDDDAVGGKDEDDAVGGKDEDDTYPKYPPLVSLSEISYEQSVHASPTKLDLCSITGFGYAKKAEFSSGLILALKHMLTNSNYFELSAIAGINPGIMLAIGHGIGGGIFGTLQSSFALVDTTAFNYGGSCSFEKNLSHSTKGILTVSTLGDSTKLKVIHQYSSAASIVGEVAIGMEKSFLKGALLYQLIPKYVFHAVVKLGTEGSSFKFGFTHEIARLTTVGSSIEISPSTGVSLKLNLNRAYMDFDVGIKLSNFVGPAVLLYATSIPLALYGCIKAISLAPIVQKEWLEDLAKQKKEMTKEVAERKAKAESAVELMQQTLERILNAEQARHGLLVTEAWYGKLFDQIQSDEANVKVIDVRVPLQCLVADSKLILHGTSKADIPGFYDPCVGERKYLRVRYEFRGTAHEVTVKDSEPLAIPRASHRLGNS